MTTLPTTLLKAMIYQFSLTIRPRIVTRLIVIAISRVVPGLTAIENRTTYPRIQTSEGIFLKRGTGNGERARERNDNYKKQWTKQIVPNESKLLIGLGFKSGFVPFFYFTVPRFAFHVLVPQLSVVMFAPISVKRHDDVKTRLSHTFYNLETGKRPQMEFFAQCHDNVYVIQSL